MSDGAVTLLVRLTPRGGRDAIDGWATGADGVRYLKVRVAAPPVEGEANAALTRLIAKALRLSPGSVRIAAGDHARLKRLEIAGAAPGAVEALGGAIRA